MTGGSEVTIPGLDPLPLPGPAWLLQFLLILTFLLHVLFMNFILGGSILAAVDRLRGRDPARPHHRALASWLASLMPVSVAAAVTFGVAPLLLVQALYGRLFFTGSILMAWFWIAVIPLLIAAYYGTYFLAFQGDRPGGTPHAVAWISAAFFTAIAFLYSNNMTLTLRPDVFAAKYLKSGAGLTLNLGDPTLIPRYLHMLLGAIAVAGLAVAHYGLSRLRRDPEFGDWAARHGTVWFVVPTALNVLVGIWWLIALPRDVMLRFMGRSPYAAAALGIGSLLGLATLVLMAVWIYSRRPARLAGIAGAGLVLTLVAMILARDEIRQGMLERAGFRINDWVEPQWGPIALFLLLLAASLLIVVWMIVVFARSRPAPGDPPSTRVSD